jgi:hypothetical protein
MRENGSQRDAQYLVSKAFSCLDSLNDHLQQSAIMRDECEGVIKTLRDNQTKCSRELESIKATADRALQKAGKD